MMMEVVLMLMLVFPTHIQHNTLQLGPKKEKATTWPVC